jgi:hypothetical protein
MLDWQTAAEINFSYFGVERSLDGVVFREVGRVLSKGSNSGSNYSFRDDLVPPNSTVYYRLRAVDLDGYFEYSKIVSIAFVGVAKEVVVFPSPASDWMNFYIANLDLEGVTLEYEIVNSVGQLLLNGSYVNTIARPFGVSVGNLPAGLYYLVLSKEGRRLGSSAVPVD